MRQRRPAVVVRAAHIRLPVIFIAVSGVEFDVRRAGNSRLAVAIFSVLVLTGVTLLLPSGAVGGIARESGGTPCGEPNPKNYTTHPSGNFSLFLPNPGSPTGGSVLVGVGANLTAEFRFKVENFTTQDVGLVVRIPGTEAALHTVGGGRVYLNHSASTFVVSGAGFSPAESAGVYNITTATTFAGTTEGNNASLSTEIVSLMISPLPWNSTRLVFEWTWILATTKVSSPGWSQPTEVVPAGYAQLVSTSPHRMQNCQWFTACLGGAGVLGNTYSLHAENVSPYTDFAQVNSTISTDASLPHCWSVFIPGSIAPSTILVHVWNYENPGNSATTLLLYAIPVTIIAAANPTAVFLGIPLSAWLQGVSIGAAGGLVVLATFVVLRYRSRRRSRKFDAPNSSR